MGFQITIQPSQRVFQAEADETILDAARRQGIILPHGCRDGLCGACRGKVLSGQVDYGKANIYTLDDDARSAGFALFCCAKAQSDLIIESEELPVPQDVPEKIYSAQVQKLVQASPEVMLVDLKLEGDEPFQFKAGQYIEILLADGRRRAFSLASAPQPDSPLQLHVRHVQGGQFTEHVFSTMQLGEVLRFTGSQGRFFLHEDSEKPVLLIAGGTGFAPIKSIVEQEIALRSKRAITIYWGVRKHSDLYLLSVAEQWVREQANISFIPVLSDSPEGEEWKGRTGFVHEAVKQDFPDLSGHQVYVCGSPAMATASRRDFVGQCMLPENEFFADSF